MILNFYLRLTIALTVLPWLALAVLGGYWLWIQGYLAEGAAVVCLLYALAYVLFRRGLRLAIASVADPGVRPDDRWPPVANEVWNRVERMAEELDPKAYPLTELNGLVALTKRVTYEVARHYASKGNRAEFDVPLRNILFITEQVCRDGRHLLDEQVPFSHFVTIGHLLQLWQWKDRFESGHTAYRIGRLLISPLASLPNELKLFFAGKAAGYPKDVLERYLLRALSKKIAYYAIALYEGRIVSEEPVTDSSELKCAEPTRLPLRILVAGQLKSGKSSLVNALLGEFRAPTDVLPLTDELIAYRWQHEQTGDVSLVDSPGYGDSRQWFAENAGQVFGDFDLILLVCSATQAGLEADARFLQVLRGWFDQHLERRQPPVLAVITHIDRLRPLRVWQPPYDIRNPQTPKAASIREAVDYIGTTLAIPPQDCLPVCLQTRALYNVEAVWTAIAEKLPDSLRTQYLRCLLQTQNRKKWALLREQLANTGRFFVNIVKR